MKKFQVIQTSLSKKCKNLTLMVCLKDVVLVQNLLCFSAATLYVLILQWYEINSNGQEIFCKSWLPKPGVRIKGALCFCHGYGDTCTFFFEGL